jgi:hypothetical protein
MQTERQRNVRVFHRQRWVNLTLTFTPARYLQITQVAFPVPIAPPVVPVLPATPAAAITKAVRLHTEAQRTFKLYHDTDKAHLRIIIEATPATYIEALSDTEFGFANDTTLQMLTHLRNTYGALTPLDRENNQVRMTKPWMPPVPIEVLFKQLEEGQRFAAAAAGPIVDSALARMGYQLILKTGLFPNGCREWRLFPDADQTFDQLKRHFVAKIATVSNLLPLRQPVTTARHSMSSLPQLRLPASS